MNHQKLPITLLLLVALSGVGACRKKSTVNETPRSAEVSTAPTPERYHQADGGVAPLVPAKFFKGSIGSQLGLQMKLTRNGEQVTGNYFYQKVGTRIDLKGTIDKDNNINLEEFDAGGKKTGIFKGSWTTDKENGLASIAGNWSKSDGDKKTAFSLHEEPIEFTTGVELVARQLKETNKKLKYEIEAGYPQAAGAPDNRFDKFNQEVKNLVTRTISAFKKQMAEAKKDETNAQAGGQPAVSEDNSSLPGSSLDIAYNIAMAKDDFVSLEFDLDSYYTGAAHANSSSTVINYDVKAGKALKLADLFNPGARYLQSISSYCIKDLKQQSKGKDSMLDNATIQSGAGPEARNYQSWTITKKGLQITFDPYQVAAYAAGPQHVLVPYSALKELIKPDGPLAPFVN